MGLARRSSTAASSGPSPADLAAETARLKREDARPSMERDIGRMAALVRGTRPPDEVWASGMSTGTSGRSPSCAACWGCPSAATRAWRSRPESARSRANRALLDDVRLAHAESGGSYGAPRVHAVLRTLGRRVGRHRVARPDRAGRACGAWRPCRAACAPPRAGMGTPPLPTGSGAASRRRGPTRSGSGIRPPPSRGQALRAHGRGLVHGACAAPPGPRSPLTPRRGPRASHTRKIVGWAMRETARTARIAVEALEMAVRRQRPAPGLICHTDRGIQHACEPCREALAAAGITPSMSRKGKLPGQRAHGELPPLAQEPAPAKAGVERVHHRVHATRAEARRDLLAWIEGGSRRPPPPLGAGIQVTGRHGAHGGPSASTHPGQDQSAGARADGESRAASGS